MKKFYAFAAAAMATLALNAAPIYLVGNGHIVSATGLELTEEGTYLQWAPGDPVTIEVGDQDIELDIEKFVAFKASTAMGDWDTFNADAFGVKLAFDGSNLGQALDCEPGVQTEAPWEGTYHVVISKDLKTITATTTTPKPQGFLKVYLRGEMNGWGQDEAWMMSTEDGITYTFEAKGDTKIEADKNFKIADGTWNQVNYSAGGPVTIDEESDWTFNIDDNSYVADDFEGTITIVLPQDEELVKGETTAVVTFTQSGAVNAIEMANAAGAEFFNLQGVRVANPENGLYIVRQGGKVAKIVR